MEQFTAARRGLTWLFAFSQLSDLVLIFILDNFILVYELIVLFFCQLDEVFPVCLLLLFQTHHSRIHINSESDDNVETDNDAEVVKDDEKVAVDHVASHDIHAHLHDNVPVVDDDEDEERDVGGHQVVKVDQIVVVGD